MDQIPEHGEVQLAEKSQGSFAAINHLFHSFTAGRSTKKPATKAPQLTDAEIANIRYTSKADFAGSALHILHRTANSVYCIATAKQTGLKLLLKSYDLAKLSAQQLAHVKTEIEMLTRLQHEGIARCRGSWQDERHLYCVEEYGIRGDLFTEMFSERLAERLHSFCLDPSVFLPVHASKSLQRKLPQQSACLRRQRLTERFIACKVLRPLLGALAYMHERGIVHRSILPEHLHFDKDLNIKLTHFSSAVDLAAGAVATGAVSMVDYMAPEVLKSVTGNPINTCSGGNNRGAQLFPFGEEYEARKAKVPLIGARRSYDQKADIWAVGCLLFELLTGKGPFEVASKELTCALILWGQIEHFPEKLSAHCVSFIKACLTKDFQQRPSAEQLLQHEWLMGQLEAEAKGIPEGLEFKAEGPAAMTSGGWVAQQMHKIGGFNRLHLPIPRFCHHTSDIEMGTGNPLQPYTRALAL